MVLPHALFGRGAPVLPWLLRYLSVAAFLAASGAAATASLKSLGRRTAGTAPRLPKPPKQFLFLTLLSAISLVLHLLLTLALGVSLGLFMSSGTIFMKALCLSAALGALVIAAFLAAQLSSAAPACALEGRNPFSAMSRSFSLARSSRLAAFPAFFVLFAFNLAVSFSTARAPLSLEMTCLEFATSLVISLFALAVVGSMYSLSLTAVSDRIQSDI
jgi:hypothetical protein